MEFGGDGQVIPVKKTEGQGCCFAFLAPLSMSGFAARLSFAALVVAAHELVHAAGRVYQLALARLEGMGRAGDFQFHYRVSFAFEFHCVVRFASGT